MNEEFEEFDGSLDDYINQQKQPANIPSEGKSEIESQIKQNVQSDGKSDGIDEEILSLDYYEQAQASDSDDDEEEEGKEPQKLTKTKVEKEAPKEVDLSNKEEVIQLIIKEHGGELFKNYAKHLIEKGIWQPWDGMDEMEYDDDTMADIIEVQDEWRLSARYEDVKGSSPYVEAIINYVEEGGDASKIIDIFKQQQSLNERFDVSTDEGKKGFILDYYTKIKKEKPRTAEKLIEFESNEEGGLDKLYKEVEDQYKEHFQAQSENLLKQQQQKQAQLKAYKEHLQKESLAEMQKMNYDKKKASELSNYIFGTVGTYEGKDVSMLDVAFLKAQRDPQMLVKLASFLQDPEKYDKMVSTRESNKKAEKAFSIFSSIGTKSTDSISQDKPKPQRVKLDLNI